MKLIFDRFIVYIWQLCRNFDHNKSIFDLFFDKFLIIFWLLEPFKIIQKENEIKKGFKFLKIQFFDVYLAFQYSNRLHFWLKLGLKPKKNWQKSWKIQLNGTFFQPLSFIHLSLHDVAFTKVFTELLVHVAAH